MTHEEILQEIKRQRELHEQRCADIEQQIFFTLSIKYGIKMATIQKMWDDAA